MSNSPLVSYVKISPNKTSPRRHKIDKITIHHMAGNATIEACGEQFARPERKASSNYGVGADGRIALYVDEADQAWTSSSTANDKRAVTIEVANDSGAPNWHVSDKALESTIALCVDICRRNGIEQLNYTGTKAGNLTMHKWFAATLCPGPYLESKFPYIAEEVNRRLGADSPKNTSDEFAVGDIVEFTGNTHYFSSNAILGKKCKPGKARVTAIVHSGRHPVQLRAVTGQGSTVYGWVDTAFIARDSAAITVGCKVRVTAGAKTYTGGNLASYVYTNTYDVISIKGDRVVIGRGNVVTAAIHAGNLTVV